MSIISAPGTRGGVGPCDFAEDWAWWWWWWWWSQFEEFEVQNSLSTPKDKPFQHLIVAVNAAGGIVMDKKNIQPTLRFDSRAWELQLERFWPHASLMFPSRGHPHWGTSPIRSFVDSCTYTAGHWVSACKWTGYRKGLDLGQSRSIHEEAETYHLKQSRI